MLSSSPAHLILDAKRLVESERRSEIRLKANGGNSLLIVCNPLEEKEFIKQMKELLPENNYLFIDIDKSLIDFVTNHKSDLVELYDLLQSSTHEIFKAPPSEEANDLFKTIISSIESAYKLNKIPVLINTGALYGTGIHNIHIMENEMVMSAAFPLIILYPATIESDKIMFLGKHPASKYRCMIIQ